jgi:DNA-binding protein HU-beta
MNAADLAVKLADQNSFSKDQAKSIVDDLVKEIVEAVSSGAEVSLPGFGKFKVRETAARDGRHPSTGEAIKIAASRKLSFTPAKAIKERLNAA